MTTTITINKVCQIKVHRIDHLSWFSCSLTALLHDVFNLYSYSISRPYLRSSGNGTTTVISPPPFHFLLDGFQVLSECKFLYGKWSLVYTFSIPYWLFFVSSTPRIFIMIQDAAMSHTDLRLPKLTNPLDTARCKITAMHHPNPSVPDRLTHLLSFLLIFRGTTGRAKHLHTFTKLREVDILVQVSILTFLKVKQSIISETNR